jgi:hypothetical protein
MSTTNYDPSSPVGVPYVRAHRVTIDWPDRGLLPRYAIEQSLAVRLADESIRQIEVLPTLHGSMDLANDGDTGIQVVHPDTGVDIPGMTTSLNQAFLAVLAVVRQAQVAAEP